MNKNNKRTNKTAEAVQPQQEEAKKNNTNNTAAEQPTAEEVTTETEATTEQQPTAEEQDTLCTIGSTPIKIGDIIRLKADTTNDTAFIEVNPEDNSRNHDKPNGWRIGTREAYKALQKACKGLRVETTYTDDRRAEHHVCATIKGCGMDSTNDRATFTLTNGSTIAAGYCFKVLGMDTDYAKTEPKTETDSRPAALIRADIEATEKRIKQLEAKRETLKAALATALQADLQAVREALTATPTTPEALTLAEAVPTANRIPADRLTALEAVQSIPAAAAAVRALIVEAYSEEALRLTEAVTPEQLQAADSVLAVMKEHALRTTDLPDDIWA